MKNALAALSDVAQGASNAAASTVTAPVDLINWLLQKAGLPVSHAPVGGSAWAEQKGLTRKPQNALAGAAGETLGMVAPIAAAAKAPQIAKGLLTMGENAAAPRTLNPQTGAIVWHGSPHKFDKFDSSKIGTGEGAQAYGHGLYLAESPGVAKSYQENLRPLRLKVGDEWVNGSDDIAMVATSLDGATNPQAVKAAFLRDAQQAKHLADTSGSKVMAQKAERAMKWASMVDDVAAKMGGKPIAEELGDGSLYKVDLPDPVIARMLDWDKPLSQQQNVLDVLKGSERTGIGGKGMGWKGAPEGQWERAMSSPSRTGEWLYREIADNDAAATVESLRQLGIPGIRYLDGGSRGAGSGTSNFVVFPGEENILTILERNGIPLR